MFFCISNFVAIFIEILLINTLIVFLTLKVHQKREKDEIDEVSELKYTEKQYM